MKTTVLLILFVFTSFFGFGQIQESKIVFKNGDTLKVKGEIDGDYFKYLNRESTAKTIHFSKIDYVEIKYKNNVALKFRFMAIKGSSSPTVVREHVSGNVSLFSTSEMRFMNTTGVGIGRSAYESTTYYVKRHEEELVRLVSSEFFGGNFRRTVSKYFSDCPLIIQKIKKREFKKKDIVKLVKFYNNNCN